ncbi:MAG TPA: amidohydrolase family protein [Nocardioides sp.]|uniref:amidohydrolase family protein n=1 Tax=Nocardioides sp. TaxID=35761 RepID=UPI002E36B6EE|nr:amidohydrolase family protein [Nocardioides sp.]HEX5090604.1 amidohydrolase family protein [Nocardioides sp.]
MRGLRAAQVFDGTAFTGPGTVMVDGDRITGVERGHPDLPDGTEVTSYDGTLLPGLIDCHVHLVASSAVGSLELAGGMTDEELDTVIRAGLAAELSGGVTTVRDLGDRRYRTLPARELPGLPRVVAAGPPITEPGGHCHYLGGTASGVDGVRRAVAEHVERGVDVIKVMASGGLLTPGTDAFGVQFSLEELGAAVEAAHTAGLEVLAHAHSLAGVRHALAAGVDGIEHATGLTEQGLSFPDEVLAELAENGVQVCPTVGADEGKYPPVELMPPGLRAAFERIELDFPTLTAARIEQLSRARAQGVRVVSGTDAGISPAKAHGGLAFAVLDLVAAGYPVAEALATATSGAATSCGLGSVTGALRPGLAADLLVVDGDVATDPGALRRPVAVLVRGAQGS